MNNYPEYAKIGDKKYKINTDFRIAIECQSIATGESISDYERALAIICVLYEEKAIDDSLKDINICNKLLEIAMKYLGCGKEIEPSKNNEEPDMDFKQDMDYIEASFMSDYNIDLTNITMHWYKFYNLINGLSNSEMGNCCVLNRVRNLRNYDTKEIKDPKERKKVEEAKKQVALKKEHKKREFSDKEKQNMEEFYKSIGL